MGRAGGRAGLWSGTGDPTVGRCLRILGLNHVRENSFFDGVYRVIRRRDSPSTNVEQATSSRSQGRRHHQNLERDLLGRIATAT